MEFYITKEEIEALKLYNGLNYEAINQLLVSNSEIDIALLSDETEKINSSITYSENDVKKYIEVIKKVYELIEKSYYSKKIVSEKKFFRGTNISEIERIKNEPYIDRFLAVTDDENLAREKFASNWNRPAVMNIKLEKDVPYINISEILENSLNKEYIILPFTVIKEISEINEDKLEENSKFVKKYELVLMKQELEVLSPDERKGLYTYILNTANSIDSKLKEAIELEKSNSENYENIRKLEQLLAKYESENDKKEPQIDFDDIERINKQLDEIKQECSIIFNKKKDLINFVTNWKRNVVLYLMSECREIEEKYINRLENNEIEQTNLNDKKDFEDVAEEKSETQEIEKDEKTQKAITKKECIENINNAEKLLENIKKLISKQQNHAKVAGNLGTTYSALNNGFEMKKITENLIMLLQNIKLKVESIIAETENEVILQEKLEKVSKINMQISTLFNYLNNPKSSIGIANITRFDEMLLIEENELKRGIYQRVRDIIGESELKKLKDDISIIEEKSPIEKLMGIFTGKNRLDEIMLEQIDIRQNAIRKTLAQKLVLAKNYSIHEIVAKIKMFIDENFDDTLVEDDILDLEELEKELKNNFVILDSRVESIIAEREGKNLPLDNKKVSKREVLEIDTYRFLNKYGYDINKEDEDVEYQDTMASEISRIIEYINSSEIL